MEYCTMEEMKNAIKVDGMTGLQCRSALITGSKTWLE